MNPLETIRLVAGREITTRIRSKAFLWTTGLLVVAIVAGGVILDLALGSSSATSVAVAPTGSQWNRMGCGRCRSPTRWCSHTSTTVACATSSTA